MTVLRGSAGLESKDVVLWQINDPTASNVSPYGPLPGRVG